MPFNLGGPELIIVLVIVLVVFGAGKLPNVMRDMGRGVKEFKKAQTDEEALAAASSGSASQAMTTAPEPSTSSTNSAPTNGVASNRAIEPAPRA